MPADVDAAAMLTAVVEGGNCSGCGLCVARSKKLVLELDHEGFPRPRIVRPGGNAGILEGEFGAICPGVGLSRAVGSAHEDVVFGRYVSVWRGYALDAETRFRGSSGGVLTALSSWLLSTGAAAGVTAVRQSDASARTEGYLAATPQELRASAGSRYAPASTGALFSRSEQLVLVGRPCEIAAARALWGDDGAPRLSFFCAGLPSQLATDSLIDSLGFPADSRISYRGNGCPGPTRIQSTGRSIDLAYSDVWGKHLGPTIQWRCKICPDGTGEAADIAVGDLWPISDQGNPVFQENAGYSVVIARTIRGHNLLMAACDQGIVALDTVLWPEIYDSQPSQVLRKRTLAGRLVGAVVMGRAVPRYKGYGLLRLALRSPFATVRAALGTIRRIRAGSTGEM